MTTPREAAALDYVGRGIPVLPLYEPMLGGPVERCTCSLGADCQSIGKHPYTINGLDGASIDPEQIRAWWKSMPGANIGLRTGSVFDVLDVDGYEGWRSLANTIAERGCLPSAPVSFTPHGGAHYLFLPTGHGNPTRFFDHADWRGQRGYIVAPPSFGSNGKPYEWVVGLDEQMLEPAPGWMLDLLEHKTKAVRPPALLIRTTTHTTTPYGRSALDGEVARIRMALEGQRNDTVNAAAFAIGQLIVAAEIAAEDAIELHAAAVAVGLGNREAERTINSGLRAGTQSPRRRVS